MLRLRHTFCLLIVVVAVSALADTPALAGGSDNAAAKTSTPDAASVTRATLDNGLNVVIVPDHLAPTVTTVMNYNVGARETPKGFPGTAHALEHMMFRGTGTLSASQISAIAAAMGGRFNANTQTEVTQYYFSVPARYVDVSLHLHAARMKGIALDAADWKKERGAIKSEVGRDLSEPSYVAYKKLRAQLFRDTPYAESGLGTKASFDQTTAAALKRFYNQWYAPNNATLVVAGDVDPKPVLEKIRALFSDIPRKSLPERPAIDLAPVKNDSIRLPTDAGTGLVYLAFRAPGSASVKRYAAARVLATILSNPRGRLYSQLVVPGDSLGTSFSVEGMRDASVAYAAAAFARGADSEALVTKLRDVLQNVADDGVTQSEVQAAKNQLITQAAAAQDSIEGLAMRWSQAVAVEQRPSPQAMLDALRQVSAQQVDRIAARILAPKKGVLTVLTPQGSGGATQTGGFGGGESFAPSHVGNVKLPAWAAGPLADVNMPKSAIEPVQTTLENGLKLITVNAPSAQAVHVYGHIRHQAALQAPAGKAGVDAVLARLLDYGTKKRDRRAYQAALDKIGAQASAGTGFSLTVLPRYFDQGLSLLAEKQRHPALPKKAFPIVARQVAAATAGQIDSPDFMAAQALRRGLFPKNDPSLRHATPQSVKALTRADVVDYYHKVFRPDLTTLVVVGDLSAQAVKKAVRQNFGDWRAPGQPTRVDLDPVPQNKAYRAHVADRSKTQDEVSIAQTVALGPSDRGYHALELGNQVLTGGFYTSRLFRELRAERGLVYYVGSGLQADRTRTELVFNFGSEPSNVQTAQRIIKSTVQNMAKEPVSDDEMHRARASLVRQIPLNASGADEIGSALIHRTNLGLPLDAPYRAARDYLDISPGGVKQAFARWVRPADWVRVIQGPKPSN